MRESCKYGSVRGAGSNPRPYRNRRRLIAGLGGAVAWPVVARAQAQQTALPVIGVVSGATAEAYTRELGAFRAGLRDCLLYTSPSPRDS